MCGRYTLTATPAAVADHFELTATPSLGARGARFNVAPGQEVPALRQDAAGPRVLELRRWGLVPHWAKDASIGNRLVNARWESAAEKPSFRDAFRRRRCLVPADGFYEWAPREGRKQPHHFHRPDGGLFAFAGLYARWQPEGAEPLETCTLLTTAANERVAELHDRMPVILDPGDYPQWLDPEARDPEAVHAWLEAAIHASRSLAELEHRPVSSRVNDVAHDDPGCLEPAESPAQPELFS